MKWFYFIFAFCPLSICGQIEIYNKSLTDTTLDILYRGIQNHMRVKGVSDFKTYTIATSTGEISTIDEGQFDINGSSDSIIILTVRKNAKTILTKKYQVRPLNRMIVRVGLIKDSIASKNEILANPFLNAYIPGSFWNCKFYITSFSATFIVNRIDSIFTKSRYSAFTKEQIGLTKELSSGDKIFFNDIYLSCVDCRSQKLPPFTLYIK